MDRAWAPVEEFAPRWQHSDGTRSGCCNATSAKPLCPRRHTQKGHTLCASAHSCAAKTRKRAQRSSQSICRSSARREQSKCSVDHPDALLPTPRARRTLWATAGGPQRPVTRGRLPPARLMVDILGAAVFSSDGSPLCDEFRLQGPWTWQPACAAAAAATGADVTSTVLQLRTGVSLACALSSCRSFGVAVACSPASPDAAARLLCAQLLSLIELCAGSSLHELLVQTRGRAAAVQVRLTPAVAERDSWRSPCTHEGPQ